MTVERPAGAGSEHGPPEYGSDLAVAALRRLGYQYLPMNPGSSFRGLHDSVVNYGGNAEPQLMLCLHEEIAVSIAHAYAKACRLPAAAAVHDLVGLMHASMAVYNAACDQVPLLLLGGSGPADPRLRRPIDWIHTASTQAELVRSYVKWDAEAQVPEVFVSTIERAHAISRTGPQGPTYVSLDAAAQEKKLAGPVPTGAAAVPRTPVLVPETEQLERAVELLSSASSVTVMAGRLARDPAITPLLGELVELLGAAYHDERNTVCFPTAHQQNCTGDRAVICDSDVVLAVGVGDLPAMLHGATRTRSTGPAVIELSYGDLGLRSWSQERGNRLVSDLLILTDPAPGASALLAALQASTTPEKFDGRRESARNRASALRERQRTRLTAKWDSTPIAPARLVAELWESVRETEWLLSLRNTRSWPEGLWQFRGVGDYLGHSVGAGVGYGPGAMVGGALAARDTGRLGVGIVGDGDFLMAAGALWTAVHYEIPMLVVINDNSSFYNDEEHQAEVACQRGRPADNSWIGMRVSDPLIDLGALSRSYGAWAADNPVTDPGMLRAAIAAARDQALAGRVAVVHVRTDPAT